MRPVTTRYLLQAMLAASTLLSTARAGVKGAPADEATPLLPPTSASAASQLWLVNTRSLPHAPTQSSRRKLPEVERYDDGWRTAHYDELRLGGGAAPVTVVFVHGNDTDDAKCREHGLALYQALSTAAPAPVRLILWSWPADYIPGTIRHDARLKAERAEADAIHLARFLADLERGPQGVVVGYSLGARVVGGALHLLAGGTLNGQHVASISGRAQPPLRSVLMAAAIDDDWLLPGHRYGRALSTVERMVLFVNPHDRVLRWYRFLSPASGPALGMHGVVSPAELGSQRRKLEQVNVNPLLGSQHGWSNYAASAPIIERLRREVFSVQPPMPLAVQHLRRR